MRRILSKRNLIGMVTLCIVAGTFLSIPLCNSVPLYDLWCDVNNDGKVDLKDYYRVGKDFGASGQNVSKASLEYDSNWTEVAGDVGQYFKLVFDREIDTKDAQVDARMQTPGLNETYGGTARDYAYAIVQTSDGGYAIAGQTDSFGHGMTDFYLVRTDVAGNMVWNKTYGGADEEEAYSVIQTNDGGYAMAGRTKSFGVDHSEDMWLVKTDANGIVEWNCSYGSIGIEIAYSVVQTSDGGYAIGGETGSWSEERDMWLVKTDAAGNMQWNKTYGLAGSTVEFCRSLIKTADGGFAMVGDREIVGGDSDAWFVKTYADGNMQWDRIYGGTEKDHASSVIQTKDGGYAIAGHTRSFGAGEYDFWLIKTDSSGVAQWNETYGGIYDDDARSVIQTTDGYMIAGATSSFGSGGWDAWLVKTDLDGQTRWNWTYGGANQDWAYCVIQTSDGRYAMAGSTCSFGGGTAGVPDAWLIKTGEVGLGWNSFQSDSITLSRDLVYTQWNSVRVRIWKIRPYPPYP
jgi:hypothetical protein